MFSSRFNYELSDNPLNILLIKKKLNKEKIIDLTISNPTLAGFDYDHTEILSAISGTESLQYNPNPKGLLHARTAVKNYYKDSGYEINPDSIFLTSGTSEAYTFLFKLLTNPGDEILIPTPSYPLIEFIANLENINAVEYPLFYDGNWKLNINKIEERITKKTKAIIIINPNNPTGSYVKKQEIEKLNEICAEKEIAIISDEVFLDYKIDKNIDVTSLAGNTGTLTFVLSGISKICALPQLKLSWIQINAGKELFSKVSERLEIITDTYLTVATPVQLAAEYLINNRQFIQEQIYKRISNNLEFITKKVFNSKKIFLYKPEGGWYVILKFNSNMTDEERCLKLLKEFNIYIHPGYFYDFAVDGFVVLSLITPEEDFKEGIVIILKNY
jgi:aspartate/methionine/tyrosine aminotransferase